MFKNAPLGIFQSLLVSVIKWICGIRIDKESRTIFQMTVGKLFDLIMYFIPVSI